MAIRFLFGEDKDYFNYEEVDNNELYDDIEEMNKDEEEKYFDANDEEDDNVIENNYTGIIDY
jgi:hypothetical protein